MAPVADDEYEVAVCPLCGERFKYLRAIGTLQRSWMRRELKRADVDGRRVELLRGGEGAVCAACEPKERARRAAEEQYNREWADTILNDVRHGIRNPDRELWLRQIGKGLELDRVIEALGAATDAAAKRAEAAAKKEAARARRSRKGPTDNAN